MPVNKVRRRGSFAPLSAHAYKDDALAEAGEAAELLYYRALSFAADVLRDGLVTDSQLIRLVAHGMKDARKRADRLVSVGLWVREDSGYRIRSWLKWNRSVDEIEALQRKDAGRKDIPPPDPDGDEPTPDSESERNPNGIQSDSKRGGSDSPNGFRPHARKPEPETETETTPKGSARSGTAVTAAAKTVTDAHYERMGKMANYNAVRAVVVKALNAGYVVDRVDRGLRHLEQNQKPITASLLKATMDGPQASSQRVLPRDPKTGLAVER